MPRLLLYVLLCLPVAVGAFLLRRQAIYTYDAVTVEMPCLYVPAGKEHWGKPHCKGVSSVGVRKAPVVLNDMGIRDRDYPEHPAPGTARILVLGSSNTLGPGIAEPSTFPRRLETYLRTRGAKVEVINAGMLGYCSIQTSFRLKQLLKRYSPNVVIYQFVQATCPLFDGAWDGRVSYEDGAPAFIDRTPIRGRGPVATWLNQQIFTHKKVFFLWLTMADQYRKIAFSWRYTRAGERDSRLDSYFAPTIHYVGYLQESSRRAGAKFLVVSYLMRKMMQTVPVMMDRPMATALAPLIRQIDDYVPGDWIGRFRKSGVPVFYASGFVPLSDVVAGDGHHFNEQGHDELARETAQFLWTQPEYRNAIGNVAVAGQASSHRARRP